jgi:Tol biopolymer transport system component
MILWGVRIVICVATLASALAVGSAPASNVAQLPSLISFNAPYQRQNGFGVINPDGTGRKMLSSELTALGWSPDGRQIVAAGYPPNRLVILDTKGRIVRVLAAPEGFMAPRWSPDGRWLAGWTSRCDPPPGSGITRRFCADLWIVRTDGSERRRLVSAGVLALGSGSLHEWAPDGRALAYSGSPTSLSAEPPRYEGIVLVSTSGRKVVSRAFRDGAEPTWAPDGSRLAFSRRGHLYVVGRDGRGLRRLTRTGRFLQPVWSPDGRRIAYLRALGQRFRVEVLDLRRNRVTPIGTVASKARIVWSPDSSRLAWSHGDVLVARADGRGGPRAITEGEDPYWR